MLDALGAEMKKIMLAGIGAVALTTEKAKDLVDDLVKRAKSPLSRERCSTKNSSAM